MLRKETPKLIDIEFHKPNFRTYVFAIGRNTLRVNVRRKSSTKYIFEHLEKHDWRVLSEEQKEHIYKLVQGQEEWKSFDRTRSTEEGS